MRAGDDPGALGRGSAGLDDENTGVIVQRVLEDDEGRAISFCCMIFGSSVDAALEIADQLLAQGYGLVTVDELILI